MKEAFVWNGIPTDREEEESKSDLEVGGGPGVAAGWKDTERCQDDCSKQSALERVGCCPVFLGGIKGDKSSYS